MFKTIASALAVTTVLSLSAAAPASAWERNHGGFGLALAAGVVGAVVGAEIASHSSYSAPRPVYRTYETPVAAAETQVVKYCPDGSHLGPYRHYCWANY